MWYDHHNEVINMSREAINGAVFGVVAALFNSIANR